MYTMIANAKYRSNELRTNVSQLPLINGNSLDGHYLLDDGVERDIIYLEYVRFLSANV